MSTETLDKPVEAAATSPAPVKASDKSIAKLIDLAEKARKRRLDAPMTASSSDIHIPQKDMLKRIERCQRERGDEPMHSLFVPQDQMKEYAQNGYLVELDEIGEPYQHQGDIAVTCTQKFYEGELRQTSARAKRKLRGAHKKAQQDSPDSEVIAKTTKVGPDGKSSEQDLVADSPFDN